MQVSDKEPPYGPALAALARLSDARENGDANEVEAAAQKLARIISRYSGSYNGRAMLDVVHRLDLGGLEEAAHVTFRHYLDLLDPVARQSSETHTGHLANYLQAHYYVYGANGEDWLKRLRVLQDRLRQGPECFERRFFLRLRLARDIGEHYGRTVVRPELEALWDDASALLGVGRRGSPMKWSGYSLLTSEAVRFRQFDLAEAWLAETIREAEAVRATLGVSAETVDIVDTLMMGLPAYVAQEKEAFSRARAAGLE
jgi:hypothetical protein